MQHFQSAYSQNLQLEFRYETYRTVFGQEIFLSSTHLHKGLFHVLKGLNRPQTTQEDCLFPGIGMIGTFGRKVIIVLVGKQATQCRERPDMCN